MYSVYNFGYLFPKIFKLGLNLEQGKIIIKSDD